MLSLFTVKSYSENTDIDPFRELREPCRALEKLRNAPPAQLRNAKPARLPSRRPALVAIWAGVLILVIVGGFLLISNYRSKLASEKARNIEKQTEADMRDRMPHMRFSSGSYKRGSKAVPGVRMSR
jgi:hypothetical protein